MEAKLIQALETRLNNNTLDIAELVLRFCEELSRRQITNILNEYEID
jgi:hypothetical protein